MLTVLLALSEEGLHFRLRREDWMSSFFEGPACPREEELHELVRRSCMKLSGPLWPRHFLSLAFLLAGGGQKFSEFLGLEFLGLLYNLFSTVLRRRDVLHELVNWRCVSNVETGCRLVQMLDTSSGSQ